MNNEGYLRQMNRCGRLAIALLLAVFLLAGCASSGGIGKVDRIADTIDIREAIILTTEGYDGAGKLNVRVDEESLARIISEANPDITEAQFAEFFRALEVIPSEKDNLSNGQEITLNIVNPTALMDQMKLVPAEESFTFQVTDLKPVEEIDPFAYVETEITGLSPNLNLSLKKKQVNDEVGPLHYLVNGKNIGEGMVDNVAIGDTIVLTVADEESALLAKGIRLEETEKTITIEDMYDKWILRVEDLDDDALEKLKEKGREHVAFYLQKFESAMIISEPKFEGAIFGESKDPTFWYDGAYLIYSFVCSNPTEEALQDGSAEKDFYDKTIYFPVWFREVKQYADGATSYEEIMSTRFIESNLCYFPEGTLLGYTDASEMFNKQIRNEKEHYEWTFTDDIKALYDEG